LAYGKPSVIAEKYGIPISELKLGNAPSAPARQTAGYVQVILNLHRGD
jgi:hypothetical protein